MELGRKDGMQQSFQFYQNIPKKGLSSNVFGYPPWNLSVKVIGHRSLVIGHWIIRKVVSKQ